MKGKGNSKNLEQRKKGRGNRGKGGGGEEGEREREGPRCSQPTTIVQTLNRSCVFQGLPPRVVGRGERACAVTHYITVCGFKGEMTLVSFHALLSLNMSTSKRLQYIYF